MSVAGITDTSNKILDQYLPPGGGGGGVSAVTAGSGITVGGTTSVPIVSANLVAGTNVTITPSGGALEISATGGGGGGSVNSVGAGTGISVTGTTANPVVNNTGVLSVTAGGGIALGGTSANPVIVNSGVVSFTPGLGLSNAGTPTNPLIDVNLSAGSNITLTTIGGGAVQVAAPNLVKTVTTTPSGSGITIGGTSADPVISANLIAGSNIFITPSGGALQIASTGAVSVNVIQEESLSPGVTEWNWDSSSGGTGSLYGEDFSPWVATFGKPAPNYVGGPIYLGYPTMGSNFEPASYDISIAVPIDNITTPNWTEYIPYGVNCVLINRDYGVSSTPTKLDERTTTGQVVKDSTGKPYLTFQVTLTALTVTPNTGGPGVGNAQNIGLEFNIAGGGLPTPASADFFYLPDVALSPINYINVTVSELNAGTATGSGVDAVLAGPGVSIGGTTQFPVVNNTGLLGLSSGNAGSNITITGTPTNPIISATSGGTVTSVGAGTGISVTGTSTAPIVNNTGVISVTSGSGISLGGSSANPQIVNTGLLGLTASNADVGIGVTGTPTNPLIQNKIQGGSNITVTPKIGGFLEIDATGVVTSVVAGSGVSIGGTSSAPVVSATGLLGLTSSNAGTNVTITGTPTNPIISATGGGGGGAVNSVGAGTGISVTGTTANPVVNNTGVLSVTSGSGISLGGTSTNPQIVNTGLLGLTQSNAGTGIVITGTATNPSIAPFITGGSNITVTPKITGALELDVTGVVTSVTAGANVTITGTPTNPIISATGGGGGAVNSVGAGTGISVTGTTANPVVNNTGVLSVTSGSGISLAGTSTNPQIVNSGLLGLTSSNAGTNITITGTPTNPIITASGGGGGTVTSVTAGPGISVTGTSAVPIVNNTGILNVTAGTGINVTGPSSNKVITNSGLLGLTSSNAGNGITIAGTSTVPSITANLTAGDGISITPSGGALEITNIGPAPPGIPQVVVGINDPPATATATQGFPVSFSPVGDIAMNAGDYWQLSISMELQSTQNSTNSMSILLNLQSPTPINDTFLFTVPESTTKRETTTSYIFQIPASFTTGVAASFNVEGSNPGSMGNVTGTITSLSWTKWNFSGPGDVANPVVIFPIGSGSTLNVTATGGAITNVPGTTTPVVNGNYYTVSGYVSGINSVAPSTSRIGLYLRFNQVSSFNLLLPILEFPASLSPNRSNFDFFFQVPAGANNFSLAVAGNGGGDVLCEFENITITRWNFQQFDNVLEVQAGQGISVTGTVEEPIVSANLVAGSNVTITPVSGGALQIASTGGGSAGTQTAVLVPIAGSDITATATAGAETTIPGTTQICAGGDYWCISTDINLISTVTNASNFMSVSLAFNTTAVRTSLLVVRESTSSVEQTVTFIFRVPTGNTAFRLVVDGIGTGNGNIQAALGPLLYTKLNLS